MRTYQTPEEMYPPLGRPNLDDYDGPDNVDIEPEENQ